MTLISTYLKGLKSFILLFFALVSFIFSFAQTVPGVISVSPVNGATGVSITTSVLAVFSEDMDVSTITVGNFKLKNTSTNTDVTSAVTYNATTRTAKLIPSVTLSNSSVYTATIRHEVKSVADVKMANDYIWSFTTLPDMIPPTVTSVAPLNGAVDLPLNTVVTAIFNEAMNASTINTSTIQLRNASNTLIPASVTYNTGSRTVTLKPSSALASFTVYTATIIGGTAGVKDIAGNTLAASYTWSFRTFDITPPRVLSVSPVNGATGVSISTAVSAVFSISMNASTITTGNFKLRNAANNEVTATVSYNATTRTATLTPAGPLANSTVYTATIRSDVKSVADKKMANDYIWSFTTLADVIPPTVTSVAPLNGAVDLPLNTVVTAIFNEAMNASTINTSTIQLRNASNTLIPASVTYNTGSRTVTLKPSSALASFTVYTATIIGGTAGVKDIAGNALVNNKTWSFTTYNTGTPAVLSVSPANGATGISISTAVSAVFNMNMNASTITTGNFKLQDPSSHDVIATVSYNTTTRTATLIPSVTLAYSSVYTATVKKAVKSIAGNDMAADYIWSFTTPAPDNIPPTITSVTPAYGSVGIGVNTAVSTIFSEAMNASTINTSTFELRNASNVLVPAAVSYNATTRIATLVPTAVLAYSTIYTATIKGGTSGVKDLAGNALATDYQWKFITVAPPDIIPPTVISVLPLNGAIGISINTAASAIFSEAMNASTINNLTFELRNAFNVLVAASVIYNATARTATLTPSAVLAYSTAYTATIKGGTAGVKDIAGNALVNNYTWSFTTAPPPDIIPPTVISETPLNGATGVSLITTVSAVFSEAMNVSTINDSAFELLNTDNTAITSVVTYDSATRKTTLTPSVALTFGTVYTARIRGGTSGVKDLANNALANDYTWSFTTANPIPYTIFQPTDVPVVPMITDLSIEAGVKFRSTQNGTVKALRFYKGEGNTGTHIGHLWSNTGTLLAEATFVNETASGWQQVLLTNPVPITAGTTYIASYFSSEGKYGFTNNYFTSAVVNGPLRALANGEDGGNGVYIYSPSSVFPTNSYLSTNYYVDLVFLTGPDFTPPLVASVLPADLSTNVNINGVITAVFNEAMNASFINSSTFELRNAANNGLIAATITYNAAANTATLTPLAALTNSTVYIAKIKGGASGVKDVSGNAMTNDYTWTFTTADPPPIAPTEGPGGPILVVSTTSNPFSRYAVEILRAEGLNEFAAADISAVTPAILNNYDVVVLGEMTVTTDQVTMFTNWVNAGGTLIAFKPSALLTPLLGISGATGTLTDKYLLVNTASGPGAGIVNQTIQFHGAANLHTLSGAASLATLYSAASTATANPAVTTINVGANGGRAIAFTYDLAKSVIYTRQGNPAWAGQKRDGQIDPIRSDDLFFPDWIDFDKVAIPQADEQQRFLVNIILQSNLHRKPLPRFWYLPRDLKAAIVMTGDDHANNGTTGRFNQYLTLGPNTPQDIADWRAVRGSSYIFPNTPITNAQAVSFEAQSFEIALHPTTGCLNFTPASLQSDFTTQLGQFASAYPGVSAPVTNRTHCLAWSDWSSTPEVELQKNMRLDVTYYYWPEVWMQNRPGMFTGSGMPMRFADMNGSLIDVYQAPTQMTDETNMNYTNFCNTVLDKAIGAEGYYGVFTANMHTDYNPSSGSDAIIASAQARQIPVVSSRQMLTWLDGRNNSSFGNMTWSNNQLTFSVTARSSANNLKAMLPLYSETGQLISITRDGIPVPFTAQTIKGIQYAFFAPATGNYTYVASYNSGARIAAPAVTGTAAEISRSSVQEVMEKVSLVSKLYVNIMPNPSADNFNMVINSNDADPVSVRVSDIFGRLVEMHQKVTSTGILRLGHTWKGGIYFAEVVQGDQRKVVKMIKTN